MKKKNEKFKISDELELPSGLRENILNRVEEISKERIRRRTFFFRMATILSIGSFFASFLIFSRSLVSSDFWKISQLLVTDFKEVVFYWQDYILSLLENFPALELFGILAPVVFALIFLNLSFENLKSRKYIYR